VRRRWWDGDRLVLTAADLRAFEVVSGEAGLRLGHPAELVVKLRRRDRLAAEEFAAELALALAERGAGARGWRGPAGDDSGALGRAPRARELMAGDDPSPPPGAGAPELPRARPDPGATHERP
jgi:hypothetical protein